MVNEYFKGVTMPTGWERPPFFAGRDTPSLSELAETQKVKPLRNPSVLVGSIPSNQDVDDFLSVIYSARKQPGD